MQFFEQHWPSMKHCWPSAVQACPQTPLLHDCEQHSAFAMHPPPFCVQFDAGWQEKFMQLPEQQLKSEPQPDPLP
jgi:hypothetical protein